MRKYLLLALPLIMVILSGCAGQYSGLRASLGEKFSLAIGQSTSITGEDLKIRFVEVIGDSRCPQGVTCIWAGEASSLIEITYSGSKYQKVLTQPGLTEPPQTDFGVYEITFDLQPYPEAGKEIKDKDYRLELQIDKKTS
jgi:hypothetical protein